MLLVLPLIKDNFMCNILISWTLCIPMHPDASDINLFFGDTIGVFVAGAIVSKTGDFVRYDPASYRQGKIMHSDSKRKG